jgi:hypothetical protein
MCKYVDIPIKTPTADIRIAGWFYSAFVTFERVAGKIVAFAGRIAGAILHNLVIGFFRLVPCR